MPPAKDHARAPLPSTQLEIFPVLTSMPTLKSYLKRTTGRKQLPHKTIYIATILVAWTFTWARQGTQEIHIIPPCFSKKYSHNILQPAAAKWLRAS
jgi:hypothetical protein